ncbi:MAG TPA: T9SS type A sorting domain-containing protein, partial [Bacteroidales bacterium]
KVGLLTWRDYNNDGFLDLQIDSNIYKNNGDGTFSLQTGITLPDISAAGIDYNNDGVSEPIGSATWVDYDNDGYVDKFSGYKIYKNNGAYVPYPKNTPPTAPTNLKTSIDFNSATLEWDKATDIITPQDQLSYNVRIGTSPEAYDVVSPEASTVNGVRWIPAIGNAGQTTGYSINNLPSGTYYWSVQAIDNAFAGGEWATENTFTITANQASNIVADNIGISKMSLSWTNGSCDRRIVLMSENNNEIAPPVNNNTTYLAKSIFGEGTQIGTSGWYCVYNGTENEVTVSGLKDGTNYSIAVLEYNGTTGNENYNTNTSAENPVVIMTKCAYEEQTEISLAGSSPTAWGDYNNDGFLDILSTAYTDTSSILKIYKNNGDGTFSEGTCISITGQSFGSAQWIDYNNDGLIDILLTGNCNTYYSEITPTILKNNGDGSFTELTETSFPSVYASSEAWGDYNNDGLGDIIIVGHILNAEDTLPRIYKNNGNGTFTKQTVVLKGIGYFPVAWGDMNKDGSLDILIADTISNNVFLRIYINDGNGNFIEKSNNLQINIGWGSAMVLGDYNNDGLLDILLSGQDSNADWVTKIYKNNGDETFSEVTGISLPSVQYSSLTWGDYNHDGLLDVLISGYFLENTYDWVPKTRIYKNNGDETFSEQSNIYLPGIIGNSTWGDYDNDGLLDILIGSNIYKNIGEYSLNNGPSAPTNLTQTVNSKTVLLEWSQASDDQTPQNGLSYNARIGKIPSDVDVVSPMTSVTDGFRRIPAIGNTGQTNKYVINNLPDGTYYWSVQAIDNAWVGGQWAKEKMFCVSDNCVDAINPATINKIMIYPNPTKDYVKIVSDIVEPYMVTITDLNGKNVLCQQIKTSEQTMHLNNLESGLYIVKLQTNSGIFVIKLIVE